MSQYTHIRYDNKPIKVKYLCTSYASPAKDSKLYLIGNEFGATHLITARSEDDAWKEYLDDLEPISQEWISDAYGLTTEQYEEIIVMDDYDQKDRLNELLGDEEWNLVEGYEYQPNATGTGIVDVGLYTWIKRYIPKGLRRRIQA